MSSERPSLAEAFRPAPAGRGAKLEGILAPKRRGNPGNRVGEGAVLGALMESAVLPEVKPKSVPLAEPGTSNRPETPSAVPGVTRNVGVYLPPALHESVKEAARRGRTTYGDLLVDAFDSIDESLLARHFNPRTAITSGSMPRRTRRPRGTAGIQIQVRLDDSQLQWLDNKVADLGAPSRSALVSAAYQLHITGALET